MAKASATQSHDTKLHANFLNNNELTDINWTDSDQQFVQVNARL